VQMGRQSCSPDPPGGLCVESARPERVLNPHSGEFTVPARAAGQYLVSFSARVDTKNIPQSAYMLRLNYERLRGTRITTKVSPANHKTGWRNYWRNDKVTISRTVTLSLVVGDRLDVVNLVPTSWNADTDITFCVSLLHLAADNPNGIVEEDEVNLEHYEANTEELADFNSTWSITKQIQKS